MAALKTNYVDDVLDTSVNNKRKYNMVQNADGTVSFDDVTTYTQNGDSFGAKDINDTNTAVNVLNENLTAYDVDTQTYSTETFKFAKSGENLGMLDSEGNFMGFGNTTNEVYAALWTRYADGTGYNAGDQTPVLNRIDGVTVTKGDGGFYDIGMRGQLNLPAGTYKLTVTNSTPGYIYAYALGNTVKDVIDIFSNITFTITSPTIFSVCAKKGTSAASWGASIVLDRLK